MLLEQAERTIAKQTADLNQAGNMCRQLLNEKNQAYEQMRNMAAMQDPTTLTLQDEPAIRAEGLKLAEGARKQGLTGTKATAHRAERLITSTGWRMRGRQEFRDIYAQVHAVAISEEALRRQVVQDRQ